MSDVPRIAPPTEVTGPVREPARYGLFSVANVVPAPEQRFQLGVYWEPVSCAAAGSVAGDCFDAAAIGEGEGEGEGEAGVGGAGMPPVATSGVGPLAEGLPFAVYGSYDCSAFSRPLDEAEARARQHLAAWEEAEVERTIAAGDRSNESTFQGADVLADGTSLADGVALIESALATGYGAMGVLHAPRRLGAHLSAGRLVDRHGARLETMAGNYVALGGGYDIANVGPDGSTPEAGSFWIYGTSLPVIRRSDVWVTPDPKFRPQVANNDVTVFAWRTYVVAWECITVAARVVAGAGGGEF